MRLVPVFAFLVVLVLPHVGQGAVVFFDDFTGSASNGLNGTAPSTRPGSQTWTAGSGFKADGSMTSGSSAWLPYAFGSGVYEVSLNMSITPSASSGFTVISFVSGAQPFGTSQFNAVTGSYSTFGLRANRDVEFWAGTGNTNNVDGGVLSGATSMAGNLRLVLDTSSTFWTVNAFYTPSGGSELTFDLNGASAGTTYTFSTNPPSLTGVGFSSNLSTNSTVNSFTLSTVPEPSTWLLFGTGIAGLYFLRRRTGPSPK